MWEIEELTRMGEQCRSSLLLLPSLHVVIWLFMSLS